MFYKYQPLDKKKRYMNELMIAGSLSRLYSEKPVPYLNPRAAENIFCDAFDAENLSRSDCSVDAKFGRLGIGIKTFLQTSTLQKIAEFNKDSLSYKHLSKVEKIERIAELRNKRLETTKRIYGVDTLIYHTITRENGRINIHEEPMQMIDIPRIRNVIETKTSITFEDGNNRYSFYLSKSTLMKHFDLSNPIDTFEVHILDNPMESLEKLFLDMQFISITENFQPKFVILPLYGRGGEVFPRSGLNQWNAAGRVRQPNEAYIPVPSKIYEKYPDFFIREEKYSFNLRLPNGKTLSAKVCQSGYKALMSDPNEELGKWLLRDVLGLREGQVVDNMMLEEIGFDSVIIYKYSNSEYSIDFRRLGAHEVFMSEGIDIEAEEA